MLVEEKRKDKRQKGTKKYGVVPSVLVLSFSAASGIYMARSLMIVS